MAKEETHTIEPDEDEHVDLGDDLFTARLVRGEVYFLRDIRFDKGCDVVVMGHHKEHLEEHAVEPVGDDDGEVMVKDKFVFKPYDGAAPVGTVVAGDVPKDANRDYDAEARMRAFARKEQARQKGVSQEAPKFDKDARDASIVRASGRTDDGLPKPRPRASRRAVAPT